MMNARDLLVYLVTDRNLCLGRSLEDVVAEAVEGGCTMVQLREKHADTGEFVELARALHGLLKPRNIPLLINDRLDVALAAGVEGVHVGQTDMTPRDVRALMGDKVVVGLSVDTEAELLAAQSEPVDYLGIGPVYPTETKKDVKGKPWGPEGLKRAMTMTSIPLVAIGGIHLAHVPAIAESGVAGVAVVSEICSAPSPREATRALVRAMKG